MITINLGFDKNPYTNKEEIKLFFSTAFIISEDTFNYREVEAKYINPETEKEETEKTAVFNIHTKHQTDRHDILFSLIQLCTIFKQDAIPYYSDLLLIEGVSHNIRYDGKRYKFDIKQFVFN